MTQGLSDVDWIFGEIGPKKVTARRASQKVRIFNDVGVLAGDDVLNSL